MNRCIMMLVLLMIFNISTVQADDQQIFSKNLVQITDIGAQKFLNHIKEIATDDFIDFSDVQKAADVFNMTNDPLYAWISIYGVDKPEGSLIFFINGNGYVSAVGISKITDEDYNQNHILDAILKCIGVSDKERIQLKNSKDQIPNVFCSQMKRRICLSSEADTILLFATDE